MNDWQERIINERAELHVRLIGLLEFLGSKEVDTLIIAEQQRLRAQAAAMIQYSDALTGRIDAVFEKLTDVINENYQPAH